MKRRKRYTSVVRPCLKICHLTPETFPIGSLESRAAARAILERRPKPIVMFSLGDSPRPKLV
jgi:hypothetical protein